MGAHRMFTRGEQIRGLETGLETKVTQRSPEMEAPRGIWGLCTQKQTTL